MKIKNEKEEKKRIFYGKNAMPTRKFRCCLSYKMYEQIRVMDTERISRRKG